MDRDLKTFRMRLENLLREYRVTFDCSDEGGHLVDHCDWEPPKELIISPGGEIRFPSGRMAEEAEAQRRKYAKLRARQRTEVVKRQLERLETELASLEDE